METHPLRRLRKPLRVATHNHTHPTPFSTSRCCCGTRLPPLSLVNVACGCGSEKKICGRSEPVNAVGKTHSPFSFRTLPANRQTYSQSTYRTFESALTVTTRYTVWFQLKKSVVSSLPHSHRLGDSGCGASVHGDSGLGEGSEGAGRRRGAYRRGRAR